MENNKHKRVSRNTNANRNVQTKKTKPNDHPSNTKIQPKRNPPRNQSRGRPSKTSQPRAIKINNRVNDINNTNRHGLQRSQSMVISESEPEEQNVDEPQQVSQHMTQQVLQQAEEQDEEFSDNEAIKEVANSSGNYSAKYPEPDIDTVSEKGKNTNANAKKKKKDGCDFISMNPEVLDFADQSERPIPTFRINIGSNFRVESGTQMVTNAGKDSYT